MSIRHLVFIIIITILLSTALFADTTYVSGFVSGRWSADNSPYLVTDNLHVQRDSTLIIEPGVSVIFTGHYKLYIDTSATFKAVGSEYDSIIFTALDTVFTDSSGGFAGIRIDHAIDDACSLVYCRIEYANSFGDWPDNDGGGLFCYGTDLVFVNNNIIRNFAGREGGGAIFWYCNPIIVSNTFAYNVGTTRGGGLTLRYSLKTEPDLHVKKNIFHNNSTYTGGGIFFGDSHPTFVNNLIFDNVATRGGGVQCVHGHPRMINNTIARNRAEQGSGFVCSWNSMPVILNNIINNDTTDGVSEIYLQYVEDHPCTTHFFYNNIDVSSYDSDSAAGIINWEEGNFPGNPMLDGHTLHLTPGSPCIDAGAELILDPATDSSLFAPLVDFEGNPRPLGDGWDVGAFEFEPGIEVDTLPPCISWGYPREGLTGVPIDTSGTVDICGACGGGYETWVDSSSISVHYSPLTEPTYSIALPFELEVIRCMGYQVSFSFAEYPLPYDMDIELCVEVYDIAGNPASECIIFHTATLESTFVCGEVFGRWTADHSPYFVDCELHVPTDSSLIIEPGCSVIFLGHYKFCVDSNALFKAIGTEEDSIIFTAIDTLLTDSTGGHHGIRFNYCADVCSLVYCKIEYGNANDGIDTLNSPNDCGGAIRAFYSCISISHCKICHNFASVSGGAIDCWHSDFIIEENLIMLNHTDRLGGAFAGVGASSALITKNIIANNSASIAGGLECDFHIGSEVSIINNLIKNNSAVNEGGGLRVIHSDVYIKGNVVVGNSSGYCGGGIELYNSDGEVTSNLISNNITEQYGGGICISNASARIANNIIINNLAEWDGGGIYCDVHVGSVLINNTIYGNTADRLGGGLYCWSLANLTIANTIFENNDDPEGNEIYIENRDTDYPCSLYISHCVIDPLDCYIESGAGIILWDSGNIEDDPLFDDDSLFHLAEGSPCIDAGTEFVISPWGDTVYAPYEDFEGDPRPQCEGWDIGADESPFSDITEKQSTLPTDWSLTAYPNPFNAEISIYYDVPRLSNVKITINNILGECVSTIVDEGKMAGSYVARWQADENTPSGVYFCRLNSGETQKTKKILLLR
ncbi:T9SS type A sorting domain-containing protein [bacterium]|nr:T9SS type A sorting domain-containing protein [bacterium]